MTGTCLCGAVKLTAEKVETEHSACHCGMCRKWAGGGPLMCATAHGVSFEGEEHIARYASSEWAERGFCKQCGTALFYFLKPNGMYAVAVGVFDDASKFQLVREIFIDRKPPGYAFAGDHTRWTEAETFAAFAPKT